MPLTDPGTFNHEIFISPFTPEEADGYHWWFHYLLKTIEQRFNSVIPKPMFFSIFQQIMLLFNNLFYKHTHLQKCTFWKFSGSSSPLAPWETRGVKSDIGSHTLVPPFAPAEPGHLGLSSMILWLRLRTQEPQTLFRCKVFGFGGSQTYLFSFVLPVSMTNTTSGIVMPVSAIFVAKTIWK